MNQKIILKFDPKTKRLVMTVPFFMAGVAREFPSRRFDPKTKAWRIPLVKNNIQHLTESRRKYNYEVTPEAEAAIADYERLAAAPKKVPFPQHVYDFTKSETGFKPMEHQAGMLDASWGLKASAWFAKMGCVAGDTELQLLLGAGKGRRMTIAELHHLNRKGRTRCRVFKADHFGQHEVVEVMQSGVKPLFLLVLSDGKTLKATKDHPILTPNGFRDLSHLRQGDQVVVHNGDEEWIREEQKIEVPIFGNRSVDNDGYIRVYKPDHPKAWIHTGHVYEHRLVMEEHLGRYLTDNEHIHHRNGVKHDNRLSNLELKPAKDHLAGHNYHKNFVGVRPTLSRVVSLTPIPAEMTYDLSMAHPYHNYVANGIVVHNTGKTFAAIHLAVARWIAGEIDAVVIICPSTLRSVWRKEFAKYATRPYEFQSHEQRATWYEDYCRTTPKDKLQVLAVSVEGLGISAGLYDSVCRFYANGKRIFTICDESSRIKNPEAKRTKRVIELGQVSSHRLILNGTPIALGIQDLWSQYEFLDPNIIGMGDFWAYKTRYIVKGGYENRQVVGYQNVDELMSMVAPYTTVVGKEVLNLPPKVMTERYVEITPEQKKLLKLIAKGASPDPDAPYIKAENILEKILRARQVVGGWIPKANVTINFLNGQPVETVTTTLVPLDKNPKMDGLMELIEDNLVDSKFVIWSTFVHEIDAIRERLQEKYGTTSVECYYGGTAMKDRSAIEDRYCNDPVMKFFIGHPTAAGLGLTLVSNENDVMVYYSGTNAYIDRAQSEDRAHRIGQRGTVVVVDLIAEKTIDEVIVESIRGKMDIETYVTTSIKAGGNIADMIVRD